MHESADPTPMTIRPLSGLPEVAAGCDLGELLADAIGDNGMRLQPFDVLVVAQKIVSKAEDRSVCLADVLPSTRACELAAETDKDPHLVELILRESTEILRSRPGVIIARHRLGFVVAQAGIDRSNVPEGHALLLPECPDASASRIRSGLALHTGVSAGVIVADSFGRPWRFGTTHVAIGAAGVPALWDRRGEPDRNGRSNQVTVVGWADAVASAAGLMMGELAEGRPAALVRGLRWTGPEVDASAVIRPIAQDLFR